MAQELLDHDGLNARGIKPKSRSQRWRMVRDGEFPKPIKIGLQNYWIAEEVDAWQAARIAKAIADRDAAK